MTIPKLLFKVNKYYFYCLGLTAMLLLCAACKTKQTAQSAKPIAQEPDANENFKQIRFGGMYVDACSERMKGNLQEALKLFLECKKLDPANAPVSYELGTIYKMLGVNDLALANAKLCATAEPKNEWYQLLLIECYNGYKQYDQSIRINENLIKNFPEKTEFKEDLAILYSMIGQYDKAFQIYKNLESIYGVNEQITLNKIKLLKEQKKFKNTETELLKLSASNPSETRYYSYLADFYIEINALEKARAMYDMILSIEPNNPMVNLALHDYYSSQGKNDEAFEYLKKAFNNPDLEVKTKSDIVNSFYKRGLELNDAKIKAQGTELSKLFLLIHPTSSESNFLYADFLVVNKNFNEAAKYYFLATRSDQRIYIVWGKLLVINYDLALYDSLEHHSSQAMELFPSQPSAYLYIGTANIQLKNYRKAAVSLKDGLEFVVDNKPLMLDFYRALGDANYYLKDYRASDKAFEDALKIDSDNTYVLNNYAYYLSLRNENLERAERLSRKTIELRPNDRNYMDTYGWILYQQKKFTESADWLEKAAKLGPKNPNILEHYGDVLFMLNKPADALLQWKAAKQAGGNSDELLKKIKDKKIND